MFLISDIKHVLMFFFSQRCFLQHKLISSVSKMSAVEILTLFSLRLAASLILWHSVVEVDIFSLNR